MFLKRIVAVASAFSLVAGSGLPAAAQNLGRIAAVRAGAGPVLNVVNGAAGSANLSMTLPMLAPNALNPNSPVVVPISPLLTAQRIAAASPAVLAPSLAKPAIASPLNNPTLTVLRSDNAAIPLHEKAVALGAFYENIRNRAEALDVLGRSAASDEPDLQRPDASRRAAPNEPAAPTTPLPKIGLVSRAMIATGNFLAAIGGGRGGLALGIGLGVVAGKILGVPGIVMPLMGIMLFGVSAAGTRESPKKAVEGGAHLLSALLLVGELAATFWALGTPSSSTPFHAMLLFAPVGMATALFMGWQSGNAQRYVTAQAANKKDSANGGAISAFHVSGLMMGAIGALAAAINPLFLICLTGILSPLLLTLSAIQIARKAVNPLAWELTRIRLLGLGIGATLGLVVFLATQGFAGEAVLNIGSIAISFLTAKLFAPLKTDADKKDGENGGTFEPSALARFKAQFADFLSPNKTSAVSRGHLQAALVLGGLGAAGAVFTQGLASIAIMGTTLVAMMIAVISGVQLPASSPDKKDGENGGAMDPFVPLSALLGFVMAMIVPSAAAALMPALAAITILDDILTTRAGKIFDNAGKASKFYGMALGVALAAWLTGAHGLILILNAVTMGTALLAGLSHSLIHRLKLKATANAAKKDGANGGSISVGLPMLASIVGLAAIGYLLGGAVVGFVVFGGAAYFILDGDGKDLTDLVMGVIGWGLVGAAIVGIASVLLFV